MFSVRVTRPQSVGQRAWNRAQDACAVFSVALIALKLAGVVSWSWWWVLSPLWISGILLALAICVVVVLLRRDLRSFMNRQYDGGPARPASP